MISSKMFLTHYRLTKISRFGKRNFELNQLKREKLDFHWRRAQGLLITKFSIDGSEEAQKKEQKLINFDPDLKKQILTEYLDRCKLRHAQMFYKWRKHDEGKRQIFIYR